MNNDNYYQKLGNKLSQIRGAKGLTQRKVAQTMGVTFQQYQKYENGSNRIPTKALVVFCELTGEDIRSIAGVSIKDYEVLDKEPIVNNYTTYINNYGGFFSSIFNMDLTKMKNKIVLIVVFLSICIYFGIQIFKSFAHINAQYNGTFLSIQLLAFVIALTVIMFAVFSYSLLTYAIAFISYIGIIATVYRFIFVQSIGGSGRVIMYVVAVALTIVTFYTLKKLKVNVAQADKQETA